MSLNWDVTNCKDPNFVLARDEQGNDLEDQSEWAITNTLIWASMFLGVRSTITESNAADWFARVSFYESVHGAFLHTYPEGADRVPHPITALDIQRRIGLSTNGCYKQEAWSTFVRRVTTDREVTLKGHYARDVAEAEVSA